ncbi:MAG TPA: ATP-binding protein, partial [Candidatus Acidoferrum sp.]|nr:ATP-binding protein [Candidatus Acidoferrum sp.]
CQIFLNLIVNAAQAIPEGQAPANQIRVKTRTDATGRVVVTVADTGSGIPPELHDRIFDPFFTTKELGAGTGLGLSICHRLVTGLGGQIVMESEVGRGTVFEVTLPSARRAETAAKASPARLPAARRGRILCVDDDVLLTKALTRALNGEHEVTALTRAREALERVMAGERYDVILCDLMMPEMGGIDLHAELLGCAPEQAASIIFLTGGAFTARARDFLASVPNQRVEKPFDIQLLRTFINDRIR